MTSIDNILQTISPELKELNQCMVQALATSNPLMNEIVTNYLKVKGKQIRPVLVILSAKMFGQINKATTAGAASIEMLHNASLIHDDVVDDTSMRRNRPTINAIWDNHIAVLVGDFFTSTSLRMAVETDNLQIIATIAELGRTLSLGEIDQINKARTHVLDEKAYLEIIAKKTASLFVACVQMGGLSVGADPERIERLAKFAYNLGLCFQIRDDIFDYFADAEVGKPTGNDLREGKVTLPLLHALSRTELPRHEEMLKLVRSENLDADSIAALIGFAVDNGGIDYAYSRMAQLREEAVEIISDFPDNPTRKAFIGLFDYIIARNY